MPLRFRKVINLAPGVRLNLGKHGMSLSVGAKGVKLNFGKKGVRQTVAVPGTGLSESDYIIKNEPESKKDDDKGKKPKTVSHRKENHEKEVESTSSEEVEREFGCFPWGCLLFVLGIAVGAYIVAGVFHVLPANLYISNILQTISEWVKNIGL